MAYSMLKDIYLHGKLCFLSLYSHTGVLLSVWKTITQLKQPMSLFYIKQPRKMIQKRINTFLMFLFHGWISLDYTDVFSFLN
jgi:hypothetical protein